MASARPLLFIENARDAAALFAPMLAGCTREEVLVAHLDQGRGLIGFDRYGGGSSSAVDLPLRAIIAAAFRLGSAGLVIAHCHPSGDPLPSDADIAVTRKLAETAAALGIRLHDHLVLAGSECRSLRALGLI